MESLVARGGDVVDFSEGFSGVSCTIGAVFQIAHVAPTLTKYLAHRIIGSCLIND